MSETRALRKYHAVYLVLDVSRSMRTIRDTNGFTQQDVFSDMIAKVTFGLNDTPQVATTTWLSVVAFADQVQPVLPMASLAKPEPFPPVTGGSATNYTVVLDYLARQWPLDAHTIKRANRANQAYQVVVADPLIFFVTDGAPWVNGRYQSTAEWSAPRDRLVEPPVGARIAAFGLPGAEERTLCQLATGYPMRNAFIAEHGNWVGDGRPNQAASLARSISAAIQDSVARSISTGTLMINAPTGMRRVQC